MKRIIKPITENHLISSLDMIETVFESADWSDKGEGKSVRQFTEEIRCKAYYLPELELIMTDENDELLGYAMFSRFHIDGNYENELLMLTPVCVKEEYQRQHISKELLEYGFSKAIDMGFKAVLVEGNPDNYRSRGFVTAVEHGIILGKSVKIPNIECLMIKELVSGALSEINGTLEYDYYDTLME